MEGIVFIVVAQFHHRHRNIKPSNLRFIFSSHHTFRSYLTGTRLVYVVCLCEAPKWLLVFMSIAKST
jgi:hypothetical protein